MECVVVYRGPSTTARKGRRVRDLSCGDMRIALAVEVRRLQCQGCRMVKQERLQWLADHPFSTKRFAFYVGRRCRSSTVRTAPQASILFDTCHVMRRLGEALDKVRTSE